MVVLYKNYGLAGLSKRTDKHTEQFNISVIEDRHNKKSSVEEATTHL